ncbi:hypothetical protein Ancab_013543 [Ancistrocladus abbreviatus]
MDRYGPLEGGAQSDPAMEWAAPGGETGLEEPMWQLGLEGGGGGGGSSSSGEMAYPERPCEPDCIYYLRTGFCGYGDRCRFNHPRDRSGGSGVASGVGRPGGGQYPERVGQPLCQYYMRTGTCKFGSSCKYHHPRQGAGSVSSVALNFYGFPLRLGEKECSYYMKTGRCKFGVTCKFHHPQPADVQLPVAGPAPAPIPAPGIYPQVQSHSAPLAQQYGVVAGNWQVARPPMMPGSYMQGPYGPMLLPPGMVTLPGWTPYPAPSSPVASPTQSTVGASQLYGITPLSLLAPAYTGSYSSLTSADASSSIQKEHSFPQRPGQPDCQYYLKTGDCKFGSSCRYHHPLEWVAPLASCALSQMGLPLRPGAPTCSYYAQHGICKFGATCKFDHPMGSLSYSPSASSLSDMPVAPYPVGFSMGALAPSSSSSDLRAEAISCSNKDSPTRMSSSMSTSSGSIGSILSRSGSVPQSSIQQSSLVTAPPAGSTTVSDEIDTHASS